ncbi:ShlB/FhaC/HecB family hemolysin secretion/activation protein [Sphingobium sp. CAP-1]|uniref:ShlB/FhaC/HecB family hemolysin secretion/activation protein n=1 Tax=Sphingobium sp. CAP-1 TaxID=2676077 RepID=UPI0018AD0F37|nr:ShlB/FhaC/HecB family hemolysin secretion/activation protein [Sphingobium sp. CAP-1]
MAYDVLGNTLLSRNAIERAVYPYLGPGRSAADIDAARVALEKAYHDTGYQSVVVQVTEQGLASGVLAFQVVEARLGEVRVTGAKHASAAAIQRRFPSLQSGQAPNLTQTEAELKEANRFPNRQVTPLIEPGATPGTINVELNVEDRLPLHTTVQLSNDYSQGTRPLRLMGSLRHADLWGLGHQATATYLVAPQDKNNLEVFSGSYLAPFENSRWSVLLYGYKSNSNIASLGGTNVLGDGYAVGLRGIMTTPFKAKGWFGSVNFGFDYKNFKETITIADVTDQIRTPIDYVAGVASYTLGYAGDADTYNASLSMTAGLRGFGKDVIVIDDVSYPVFGNKRGSLDARANFVHLNLDADYTHIFRNDIALFLRASAQLADSPLISNEQFAAGGLSSVRGYYQSEAVGDDGAAWTVELRSPSLGKWLRGFVDEWRFYGFSDAAYIGVRDPASGAADSFKLWSAGVGTRFQFFKILSGEAALAWPIKHSARGDGPFATFSVKAEY